MSRIGLQPSTFLVMSPILADASEIDLRRYLAIALRRWPIVLGSVVLTASLAAAFTVRQDPQYRADAEVLLQGDDAEERLGALTPADPRVDESRVDTEISVIESRRVRDAVEAELGREPDVTVDRKGKTDVVEISASSRVPALAAEEADLYATTYVEWRRAQAVESLLAAQRTVQAEIDALETDLARLDTTDEVERRAIETTLATYRTEISNLQLSQRITRTGGVQIISEAEVPEAPFSPQSVRNGILALVAGLALGGGLAFARETLDDRLRSKDAVELVTGWPTIGLIPRMPKARRGTHDLVTMAAPMSPSAEAFRALRTSIQFAGLDRPLEVIQVTSPRSGDGKTTTASNLAVTLARAGKRVALVDADLRKPRVHEEFGLRNRTGFTSMLRNPETRVDAVQPTRIEGLSIVTSGPPPPDPSELLGSAGAREAIEWLRSAYDVVIVDSPPVLPVADPLILSAYVDGVLVVTDAGSARAKELGRARELLDHVGAAVVGISANRVGAGYGYGGYGYGYGGYADTAAPETEPTTGRGRGRDRRGAHVLQP